MTAELLESAKPWLQLRVSEIFGPTIQGEGPAAGRAAMFVRLLGCNLSCSWCDSAYTWDNDRFDLRAETRLMTADDIVDRLDVYPSCIVVLTGGEPLLQQTTPAYRRLLNRCCSLGMPVHVETNGTIAPVDHPAIEQWIVSPKLANAGSHRGHQTPELHRAWLDDERLSGAVALKFVCRDESDVGTAFYRAVAQWGFLRRQTWVMPEGQTVAELADRWPVIAEAAALIGINATHRLHTLAWGNERGH